MGSYLFDIRRDLIKNKKEEGRLKDIVVVVKESLTFFILVRREHNESCLS